MTVQTTVHAWTTDLIPAALRSGGETILMIMGVRRLNLGTRQRW